MDEPSALHAAGRAAGGEQRALKARHSPGLHPAAVCPCPHSSPDLQPETWLSVTGESHQHPLRQLSPAGTGTGSA